MGSLKTTLMNNTLLEAMIAYDAHDPMRIQHFMKVYAFASLIGKQEGLDEKTQMILETAAITHDIGIHEAEKQYGNSAGKHQEELGPNLAIKMLTSLGYAPDVISRVAFLIGHHHTYHNMTGLDYQILVEADFLVNIYEDDIKEIQTIKEKIFKTPTGLKILEDMYEK